MSTQHAAQLITAVIAQPCAEHVNHGVIHADVNAIAVFFRYCTSPEVLLKTSAPTAWWEYH